MKRPMLAILTPPNSEFGPQKSPVRLAETSVGAASLSVGSDSDGGSASIRRGEEHLPRVADRTELPDRLRRNHGKQTSADFEANRIGRSDNEKSLRDDLDNGRPARLSPEVPESEVPDTHKVDRPEPAEVLRDSRLNRGDAVGSLSRSPGDEDSSASKTVTPSSVAGHERWNAAPESDSGAQNVASKGLSQPAAWHLHSVDRASGGDHSGSVRQGDSRLGSPTEVSEKPNPDRPGAASERIGVITSDSTGPTIVEGESFSSAEKSVSERAAFQAGLPNADETVRTSTVMDPKAAKIGQKSDRISIDEEDGARLESRSHGELLKTGANGSRVGSSGSRSHRPTAQQQSSAEGRKDDVQDGDDAYRSDGHEVSEKRVDQQSTSRTVKSDLGNHPPNHIRTGTTSTASHAKPTTHWIPGATVRAEHASPNARVPEKHARTLSGEAAPDRIFDQIVQATRLERQIGMERFTVTLKPAFLGRIEIETDFSSDDGVRAVIRVEDPSVKKAVEEGLKDLLEQLGEQGVDVDSAEVSDFQGGDGGRDANQSTAASPGRAGIRNSSLESIGEPEVTGTDETDDGVFSYFA